MVVLFGLTGLAIAGLLPLVADAIDAPREIVLVARDMTFYLEGQAQPNPTIRVTAGEEVRVVLRNEEAGIIHDFTVEPWRVAVAPLSGNETGTVVFPRARRPGRYPYVCTPHSEMMRGIIEVIRD